MQPIQDTVTQKPLSAWIFSRHFKLQILLLISVLLAVVARVLPLEMQKRIVNEAIERQQVDLLVTYGSYYLAAFVLATVLKYTINFLQAVIGQRTLADMRKALYAHLLALPAGFFRDTQPGLVVAALVKELATAGDFVGMAVAVPAVNVLTLLAFAGYLFWLNPLLAALSMLVYPLVLLLVPRLQRKVNHYNRQRVDASRELSSNIGESVDGIQEIQANGAFQIQIDKYGRRVDRLRAIRIRWWLYRYGIKALNSFFTNLNRFLIFAIGGYLAIKGRLELGALVAFLSAQEKLYDPWKELIGFYQAWQTAQVTYERTMSYFDRPPEHALAAPAKEPTELSGRIEVEEVSFMTAKGARLLSDVSFALEPGEHMALVGFSGSGKSTLAHCLVRLLRCSAGDIRLDGRALAEMPRHALTHNVAFVAQRPFIFKGTLAENLLFACRARYDSSASGPRLPELHQQIEVLQQTGLFADVLRFGLNRRLNRQAHQDIIPKLLTIRRQFHERFRDKFKDEIEFYDVKNYLHHASIAENLLFGSPAREAYELEQLPDNPLWQRFLSEQGLKEPLLNLGRELALQIDDILGSFTPTEGLLADSPIALDEMADYAAIANRCRRQEGFSHLKLRDRRRLLRLALRFTPRKHTVARLSPELKDLILKARGRLRDLLRQEAPDAIASYDMESYIDPASILTNIIFGQITTSRSGAQQKIHHRIHRLLIKTDCWEDIVALGMQYPVGGKGENLSGGQRQKLAIGRALLKQAPILIMDEATSSLDNSAQARIQDLLESQWKGRCTLIAVVHRLDIIKNYDKIAVMKEGRIVERGTYDELIDQDGVLSELVQSAR